MPAWLEVHSLDDLKRSLVDALIVVLAVKGIEKLVAAKAPLDALYFAAAIGALVVAFTWFRSVKGGAKPSAVAMLPGTAPRSTPAQPADS